MNALELALERLAAGTSLTAAESEVALAALLDGEASEATAAALLTALRIKGETADELAGAVAAVRRRMTPLDAGPLAPCLLDTCGTGGDGGATINISTAAAIVTAACGVPVAKHGNRAATGRSGSSDVLAALGVAPDPDSVTLERTLQELKIAFLFAPRFHPGLKKVAPLRRQLPFRTLFNLVGPLCNAASPPYQLIGVPNEAQAELLAQAVARQPHIRRALVVTGSDGLDEITLAGPTLVRMVEDGRVEHDVWMPEAFGLSRVSARALEVQDAFESAKKLVRLLAGESGPARDYVLANCAGALWTADSCSLSEGVERGAEAIDSGAALRLLERWRELAPAGEPSADGGTGKVGQPPAAGGS
jgi:anthranilate phosphoribosyltransferase